MKRNYFVIILFVFLILGSVTKAQTFYNMVGASRAQLINAFGYGDERYEKNHIIGYSGESGTMCVYKFKGDKISEASKFFPTTTKYEAQQLYANALRGLSAEGFSLTGTFTDTGCTMSNGRARIRCKVSYVSELRIWQLVLRAS